jgi:hypothetical protein
MSLKPHPLQSVPEETARVAQAAFPHGTPYLTFRDELGPIFQFEALQAARAWYASDEGQQRYKRRAGVEGTLSQGMRAFGLRGARYHGLAKTHLQHVATAAAMNVDRIVAWLDERPRAKTRTSRFAALAPACGMPANAPSI